MAKSIYIVALIATAAILAVVFFSVMAMESSKAGEFNTEIAQFALENELQSAYSDFDSNNSVVYCAVVQQGIDSLSRRADVLEKQLLNYQSNSFNTSEFISVKRSYLLMNMILFRNFLKANEVCDLNMGTVLFFYSEDTSCGVRCTVEYSQLWQLSQDCNSVRIFKFPYNWPFYEFTKILETKYGVSKAGTLVINGVAYDELLSISDIERFAGCLQK